MFRVPRQTRGAGLVLMAHTHAAKAANALRMQAPQQLTDFHTDTAKIKRVHYDGRLDRHHQIQPYR